MCARDPYEAKHKFLNNKGKTTELKPFSNPKAFTEYSNDMQDIYKTTDEYNVDKERKILVFNDMISDILITKT